MLLDEWQKFKGWAVLEFFLRTQKKIHLKGVVKELRVSPRTAQVYLQLYAEEGILEKERLGNLTLYSLTSTPLALELKRLYLLLLIRPHIDAFVASNAGVASLVMYGSSARGDYDAASDIDLLVISGTKALDLASIKSIEEELGREARMEIMNPGELRRLAEKKDAFYLSVIRNSVVLYGAGI